MFLRLIRDKNGCEYKGTLKNANRDTKNANGNPQQTKGSRKLQKGTRKMQIRTRKLQMAFCDFLTSMMVMV